MIEQQYTACHWRVITTNDSSVIWVWHNKMVSGCLQDSWYEKRKAKRSSPSSTDLPLDSISSIEFAWYLIEWAEETKKLIRQACSLKVRRTLAETLFFFFLFFPSLTAAGQTIHFAAREICFGLFSDLLCFTGCFPTHQELSRVLGDLLPIEHFCK